ncbi:roadblock/LC7 domain-containing protein [Streptomyces sparsus]
MANVETSLKETMASIEGSVGAALVDYTSGMALGSVGGGKDLDLTVAAAGNTDVIRAKVRTMEHLGLKDEIEDVLITLGTQYHLIRLIKGRGGNGLFLYLVLDKRNANLAMARHQLKRIEAELEV